MIILQAIKVLKVVSQRALVFGTEVAIPAFGSAPTATLRLTHDKPFTVYACGGWKFGPGQCH